MDDLVLVALVGLWCAVAVIWFTVAEISSQIKSATVILRKILEALEKK